MVIAQCIVHVCLRLVFICWSWKATFLDKWHRYLQASALPVTQPVVSQHCWNSKRWPQWVKVTLSIHCFSIHLCTSGWTVIASFKAVQRRLFLLPLLIIRLKNSWSCRDKTVTAHEGLFLFIESSSYSKTKESFVIFHESRWLGHPNRLWWNIICMIEKVVSVIMSQSVA